MHAGALNLSGMTKVVEWISAPQTDSIRNGDYEKLSNSGLNTIMESILHRITKYVDGEASADILEQETYGNYTVIKNDPNGWVLVESEDPHVYTALYKAGFNRVVISRPLEDGSNAVSIGKKSDFIDNFPLSKIFDALNKIDPIVNKSKNITWGGGSMIGGAPRNEDGSRTRMSLEDISDVINCIIEGKPVTVKKPIKKRVTKKKKV